MCLGEIYLSSAAYANKTGQNNFSTLSSRFISNILMPRTSSIFYFANVMTLFSSISGKLTFVDAISIIACFRSLNALSRIIPPSRCYCLFKRES